MTGVCIGDPPPPTPQVEVVHPGSGKTFTFPCNEWLTVPLGRKDGVRRELQCTAVATQDGAPAAPPAQDNMSYSVMIHTGSKMGAGTDAKVFLTVIGSAGRTFEKQLVNPAIKKPFERGHSDPFTLEGQPDVGVIQQIVVRSDSTGMGSDWFLSKVRAGAVLDVNIRLLLLKLNAA